MILRKERLKEVCDRRHPKNIEQREITLISFSAVHLTLGQWQCDIFIQCYLLFKDGTGV